MITRTVSTGMTGQGLYLLYLLLSRKKVPTDLKSCILYFILYFQTTYCRLCEYKIVLFIVMYKCGQCVRCVPFD